MAVVEAAVTEVPEEIVAAVVAEEVVTVEVTAAEEVASVATGAAVIAEVTVAGEVASVATEAAVIVEVTVAEVAFVVIEAAEVVADSAAAEAGIRTLARRSTNQRVVSQHQTNQSQHWKTSGLRTRLISALLSSLSERENWASPRRHSTLHKSRPFYRSGPPTARLAHR